MTENIIPQFRLQEIAPGFNPFNLSTYDVGTFAGWYLLPEGYQIMEGDGFYHPDYEKWIDYDCRPDIFRGSGRIVHTWPWRRMRENLHSR